MAIKDQPRQHSEWIKPFLVFFGLALLVYLPAFVRDFALGNDFFIWDYDKANGFFSVPETTLLIVMGRPLGSILQNLQFSFIDTIPDFAIARFFSFVFCVAFSFVLAVHFYRRFALSRATALALALAVLALPATQVSVMWTANFTAGSLTILLAFSAYLVLDGKAPVSLSLRIAIAQLLFMAALLTYQPNALSLLIFPFAKVLFSDSSSWRDTRRTIVRDVLFVILGMSIYFVSYKYVVLPILAKHFGMKETIESIMSHPRYSLTFATDIVERSRALRELSAIAISGAWHPVFHMKAFSAILSAIVTGATALALLLRRNMATVNTRSTFRRAAEKIVSAGGLILLANAPLLASQSRYTEYRLTFAYSAMAVVTMFWLLDSIRRTLGPGPWRRIPQAIILCLAFASGLVALVNVANTTQNANMEVMFLRQEIASAQDKLPNIKRIEVYRLPFEAKFIDKTLTHEFRQTIMNTYIPFPTSLIKAVLHENGVERDIDIKGMSKPLLQSTLNERPEDADTLLVDMNEARRIGAFAYCKPRLFDGIPSDDNTHPLAKYQPDKAFDNITATRWSASWSTPLPHWLKYDFGPGIAKNIRTLRIYPNKDDVSAFKFQASNDNFTAETVDLYSYDGSLLPSSWNEFTFANPRSYRYYRIYVTAPANDTYVSLHEVEMKEGTDDGNPED